MTKPLLGTLLLLSAALGPPAPSASASALGGGGGIPLDEALLDDMLTSYLGHEPTSCHGDGSTEGTTSFTFDWPGPGEGSEWYSPHAGFERDLFLAEMSHDDTAGQVGSNGTSAGENSMGHNATLGSNAEDFPEENLSYLKTAWQSSTSYGAEASRAVDGNTDGHFWGESLLEKCTAPLFDCVLWFKTHSLCANLPFSRELHHTH